MNDRISVDEYRRLQGLPARGQPEQIFDGHGLVNRPRNILAGVPGDQLTRNGAPPLAKAHHLLGRMGVGIMNKTEARFERQVLLPAKNRGEIVWYCFEAIKFRIALDRCWLTIDFFVQFADGHFEAIDVKGARAIVEEDAKVKMKVAVGAFPFTFKYAFPQPAKLGGGWFYQEIKR